MENKKISMIDIANLSGVSVATVSRILNKNGRYSAETEQKVMEIIKKYGYQINLSAKALRTSKSQSVGVIVPDITNEFFAKIVRSIEIHLAEYDYTVFVCDSNEDIVTETKHIKSLAAKDVDGIIFISGSNDVASLCKNYNIPFVYIDRKPDNAGLHIVSDNKKGGYIATRELISKGCRKIIMLRDSRNLSPIRDRLDGYKMALNEAGIEFDQDRVVDIDVDYNSAKSKITRLLQNGAEFDGVFACNDVVGIGVLHALRENSIKVPKQVKIVGFDDITLSQICHPPMTTVHQDTESFGKCSVEAIMNFINGNRENLSDSVTVDVSLKKRKTS